MLIDQRTRPRVFSENGILYFYDLTRNKWLSSNRETIIFGINHNNIFGDRYMAVDGKVKTMVTGKRVPRKGTITSLTIQSKATSGDVANFHLRRNGISTDLTTISVSGVSGNSIDDLNVDIDEDDWLQAYVTVDSGVTNYPVLSVEVAWRR